MTADVSSTLLVGFLLAMIRGAAWVFISPPFAGKTIPVTVKVALSMALALPVASRVAPQNLDLSAAYLIGAVLTQVLAGLALGFVTVIIFAALQAAGDLIDLFGGFSLAAGFDPLSMQQSSIFGRLNSLLGVVLLFVLDGHLLLMRGFFASYDALPIDGLMNPGDISRVVTVGVVQMFVAALQIAAPLVGVLFLVDAGLGLLTKISPSLNAFSLGFPAKILVTLLLMSAALPLLPGVIGSLTDMALRAMAAVSGG